MLIGVTLVFSALFCIGGTLIGFVLGWFLSEKYSEYMELKTAQVTTHPEMYDEEGNLLNTELTALRFVIDESNYYDDEED
jgi:hypothetical protein